MGKTLFNASILCTFMLFSETNWSHHSFAAEFDVNRPIEIAGRVVKVQWINPHAWIHVQVVNSEGSETWKIEGGTPNTLFRRGITRDTLPIGTKIVVRGYQVKGGGFAANGREITLEDGSKLFVGTSGVGSPDDGAEKSK